MNVSPSALWVTALCLSLVTCHAIGFIQGKRGAVPIVAGVSLDVLVALVGTVVYLMLHEVSLGWATSWVRGSAVLSLGAAAGGAQSYMVSMGAVSGVNALLAVDRIAEQAATDRFASANVASAMQEIAEKMKSSGASDDQVESMVARGELSFLVGYLSMAKPELIEIFKPVLQSNTANMVLQRPNTPPVTLDEALRDLRQQVNVLVPPAAPPTE